MAIHKPPQYRYSLFGQWDKEAFYQLKKIGKTKRFPKIIGSFHDKNQFLITLIRTQKALGIPFKGLKIMKKQNTGDWRTMLVNILRETKERNTINTVVLNNKYPPESIGKDVPAWVVYEDDKIVSDFIDDLETKKITFEGTDEEMSEFVMRFILGQLGHDWEETIMMIWEMLGDGNKLNVKALNEELKNFDYVGLFK